MKAKQAKTLAITLTVIVGVIAIVVITSLLSSLSSFDHTLTLSLSVRPAELLSLTALALLCAHMEHSKLPADNKRRVIRRAAFLVLIIVMLVSYKHTFYSVRLPFF